MARLSGETRSDAASLFAGHPRAVLIGLLVGALCGVGAAAFLALLDAATRFRMANPAIVWALPAAGVLLGVVWSRLGRPIAAGNNLVIDTIHDGGPRIPPGMAPMVVLGTVWTHLFGGSAGREGTAVQMGASIADAVAHRFGVDASMRAHVLAAGVAGGFGGVFGTPLAGAIFGIEFVVRRRPQFRALLPALAASFAAHGVATLLGTRHTAFAQVSAGIDGGADVLRWLAFAVAMAAVAVVFVESIHRLKAWLEKRIPSLPLRMAVGGAVVVALWQAVGTGDHLGLGVETIVRAFEDEALPAWTFAAKMLFTIVTLASGFVGGEVTPLFFIGATAGNVLSRMLSLPLDACAAVGMVALFGAAANAPVALAVMAGELFGPGVFGVALLVTSVAWTLVGRRSLYTAQLRGVAGG